jgi:hypothetical protein
VEGLGHCLQSRKLTLLNYLRLKSEGRFGGRKSLFESRISSLAPYYRVTRHMGSNTIPGISVSHETRPQTIRIHVQYINFDKQLRDLYYSSIAVIVTSYIAEAVRNWSRVGRSRFDSPKRQDSSPRHHRSTSRTTHNLLVHAFTTWHLGIEINLPLYHLLLQRIRQKDDTESKWTGAIQETYSYIVFVGYFFKRDNLVDLCVYMSIVIKWILGQLDLGD